MARRRVSDVELRSILNAEISQAVGNVSSDIAEQRAKAMDFYLGDMKKHLPVPEGRSQAVSSDVQDVVEGLMPSLMEIFTGGDEVAHFNAQGPEDEDSSQQETDYVNHVFYQENNGFQVLYEALKDGLLQKTGIIKWWAEKAKEKTRETYEGLTYDAAAVLLAEDGVEVAEREDRPGTATDAPDNAGTAALPPTVDLTILREAEKTRIKVAAVPPEEFLVCRDARRGEEWRFVAHRVRKPQSDLIAMGLPRAKVEKLETWSADLSRESQSRDTVVEESDRGDQAEANRAMRLIEVFECYLKVDRDGDGIAERRKILTDRQGSVILLDEEHDDIPFAVGSPIMQPHRIIGRSVADLVLDIQLIKTAVLRQTLDNAYHINNARTEVPDSAVNEHTYEDLMAIKPGGIVRTAAPGMLQPLVTQPLGAQFIQIMEMMDGARETRTGVTRYNQGVDANSLNKTASGINQIMGQAQMRIRLIARVFAETLVRDLMRGLHGVILKHDHAKRVVRLRNKWVPVDPSQWRERTDMTISVGLGTGSRETVIGSLMQLIGLQAQAIQFQGGVQGPLITADNVHATFKKLVEAMGFKNAEQFVSDPAEQQQPQQPKPDPAMAKVQADIEAGKAKLQSDQQLQQAKLQGDMAIKQKELEIEIQKLQVEMTLKREEMQFNHGLKQEQQQADISLAGKRQEGDLAVKREGIVASAKPAVQMSFDPQSADGIVKALSQFMEQQTQRDQAQDERIGAVVQAMAQGAAPRSRKIRGKLPSGGLFEAELDG